MQLNNTIIRGALQLSYNTPVIKSAVHNMIKPLNIIATNATFSNDITVTNIIHSNKVTSTYIDGNKGNAIISSDVSTGGSYVMLDRLKSTNGVFTDGVYNGTRVFYYTSNSIINAGTNSTTYALSLLDEDGNTTLANSLTVPSNLTVRGTASITGAITAGSTITANGAITGKSTLDITGAITAGSTITANGAITGKSTLDITGAITAGSTITANGNISSKGTIKTVDANNNAKAYMDNNGNILGGKLTISKIILGASYGTGDPPSGATEGQIYFKII